MNIQGMATSRGTGVDITTLTCPSNLSLIYNNIVYTPLKFQDAFYQPKTAGFGIVMNVRKKKQRVWISVSRGSSCVRSSLSVTQTNDNMPLKGETEFKSSFDEYLKAMESIRADREHTIDQKDGGEQRKKLRDVAFSRNGPKNWRREDSRLLNKENTKYQKEGGEVRKKLSNAAFTESAPKNLRREDSRLLNKENMKDQKEGGEQTKMLKDVAFSKSAPKNLRREDPRMLKGSEGLNFDKKAKLYVRSHVVADKVQLGGSVQERVVESSRKEVRYIRSKDDSSKNSYMDTKAVTSSKRVWKKSMPMDDSTSYSDLEMERSIFQPPALSQNDVYDSPRVTQREMQERIQNLAKRLNEANVEMPEWMFSKTMRSARIRYSDTSIMSVIQILGKLGNWRMVLQVVEWLQKHERFKSHKIRYVYTAALGVLGKERRPIEALNLFSVMQRHKSTYPDIVAYHSIAVTLGQTGHMKELLDVIDSMRLFPTNLKIEGFEDWDPRLEPDIVVYNAVLNACAKRNEWEGAFWVLQKLAEIDQQPSSTTYGLLMEVMLACGKYDLVFEFFRQMMASCAPNALTYRVLVNTLWRKSKPDEAIAAVQEMESRGIVGSASLYYDLARCLCSAGRCDEALMQVDKICKVASKPLVVTYTGMMQASLDSGHVEDAKFIFNHMRKYCSLNLIACNILLKGYLRHGIYTKTKELFQKMTQGELEGSRANSHIKPDIHTFNLMIEYCIKESRWDDFDYAYDQMLKHGHPFNTKRHLWMVLQASKAGKVEVVETTWRHLMESNQVPPPGLVKERFRLKMENGDLMAAISTVGSHPSSHQQSFSKEAWSKLLEDNSNVFSKEALEHLMREINVSVSSSESPNLIFQNLRDSCIEFVGLPTSGTTLTC